MKIWHISDTHTFHELLKVPINVDMVIFSGDCSNVKNPYSNEPEVRRFLLWFSSLNIKYKIFVAGNHDTSIENKLVSNFKDYDIIYLENNHVIIEGIKIFGSPYTPTFGDWAFMKARHKLGKVWNNAIDSDTDIIIVHGPPKGILDLSYDRNRKLEFCGDNSLMKRVIEINPKLMLFGHIHNADDITNAGFRTITSLQTKFSNGSVVTDKEFGKLTSNGNVFEIKQSIFNKLKHNILWKLSTWKSR